MRFLLLGANGLLGQNLASTRPGGIELVGAGLEPLPVAGEGIDRYLRLDITDREGLSEILRAECPDWILNAAAMTDVDGCERDPDRCRLLNRDVVRWMAESRIRMVQISTDYVFDGENGPYSEGDAVRPLSEYGRSKWESESAALSVPGSLVLRTMLLWGAGKGQKKSFNDFVRETLEAGQTARIVTDQIGDPTLAEDLAAAVWGLAMRGSSGLFHVSGADRVSRLEWARSVADHFGLDPAGLHPVTTAELRQTARRPLNSGFYCDRLEAIMGWRPRGLRKQLQDAYPR